jgi:hypothetical protein
VHPNRVEEKVEDLRTKKNRKSKSKPEFYGPSGFYFRWTYPLPFWTIGTLLPTISQQKTLYYGVVIIVLNVVVVVHLL